ncbi:hypothetical protein EUTSA_v10012602mg [Eutrema salsugineum]|uniref:non-specific serine/threonine protein kinase n=1 Tax=Eutrema salsugineum TaxID=72664 RepID=V4LCZ6_EUTSA|nr:protein kinase PVPK-1 [Eutrema salsugineum]ESQ40272.1 hypothetical protein EUTSA_v10012602mg [Eutrema salsugineum]
MGSFAGKCEIVEEKEDRQNSIVYSTRSTTNIPHSGSSIVDDKDLERPVLKLGYRGSLEDDINQLFESISIRTSGMIPSYQVGASSSSRNNSSLPRNALKSPANLGGPRSPSKRNAEPATLKQALRDLCVTKASETAASKRTPKTSTGGSVYGSVLVEPGSGAGEEGKAVLVELLDEAQSSSTESISQQLRLLKIHSASQNSKRYCDEMTMLKKDKNLSLDDQELGRRSFGSSSPGSGNSKTVVGLKSVRKVRLLYANTPNSTIVNGKRVAKLTRTIPRGGGGAKPALRSKGSVKKKAANVYDEVDGFYDPIAKELLCHRCHFALKNAPAKEETTKDTPVAADVEPNQSVKEGFLDELASDFSSSSYESSHEISASAETKLDKIRSSVDLMNPETSTVSPRDPFCNKNMEGVHEYRNNEITEEDTLSGKEVDQKDSVFMSEQSMEIGSFSEKSVVMNPDSPPKKLSLDRAAVEDVNENSEIENKGEEGIGYNSSSTSISEEEQEQSNNIMTRSSFGNRPHMSKDVRWEAIQHIRAQHGLGSLGLRHFNLLKKLGCGDIGTVYLAELTGTNCLFAIKVMDNEFLERRNKMSRAQTEKDILKMLDHPFLPTLYAHFTSDNLSCLVMECCPGGDLHVLRQKQPGRWFPEPAARFYVAEVLLALEYLHMLGVIYRDLKPENILVRDDGHIMVTDFDLSLRCTVSPTLLNSSSPLHGDAMRLSSGSRTGSNCIEPSCFRPKLSRGSGNKKKAKQHRVMMKKLKKSDLIARFKSLPQLVAEPTDARSNSFVGTHEYLAPEIIKGEGHGAAVDWWTFGIFLYELLYGKTPFKGATNEETIANVVLQSLKFPDNPNVSFQAKDLIRGLLVKEPENRLGTEKGAAEIKRHAFFEGLNWALIRCAIPPELPDFYDYGVPNHEGKSNYLDCKAVGEHLEFELF